MLYKIIEPEKRGRRTKQSASGKSVLTEMCSNPELLHRNDHIQNVAFCLSSAQYTTPKYFLHHLFNQPNWFCRISVRNARDGKKIFHKFPSDWLLDLNRIHFKVEGCMKAPKLCSSQVCTITDASEHGYSTDLKMIARCILDGEIQSGSFKQITIPRMEFEAAVLAVIFERGFWINLVEEQLYFMFEKYFKTQLCCLPTNAMIFC